MVVSGFGMQIPRVEELNRYLTWRLNLRNFLHLLKTFLAKLGFNSHEGKKISQWNIFLGILLRFLFLENDLARVERSLALVEDGFRV